MEIINLLDKEFKEIIRNMLIKLRRRKSAHWTQENFNQEIENISTKQTSQSWEYNNWIEK